MPEILILITLGTTCVNAQPSRCATGELVSFRHKTDPMLRKSLLQVVAGHSSHGRRTMRLLPQLCLSRVVPLETKLGIQDAEETPEPTGPEQMIFQDFEDEVGCMAS